MTYQFNCNSDTSCSDLNCDDSPLKSDGKVIIQQTRSSDTLKPKQHSLDEFNANMKASDTEPICPDKSESHGCRNVVSAKAVTYQPSKVISHTPQVTESQSSDVQDTSNSWHISSIDSNSCSSMVKNPWQHHPSNHHSGIQYSSDWREDDPGGNLKNFDLQSDLNDDDWPSLDHRIYVDQHIHELKSIHTEGDPAETEVGGLDTAVIHHDDQNNNTDQCSHCAGDDQDNENDGDDLLDCVDQDTFAEFCDHVDKPVTLPVATTGIMPSSTDSSFINDLSVLSPSNDTHESLPVDDTQVKINDHDIVGLARGIIDSDLSVNHCDDCYGCTDRDGRERDKISMSGDPEVAGQTWAAIVSPSASLITNVSIPVGVKAISSHTDPYDIAKAEIIAANYHDESGDCFTQNDSDGRERDKHSNDVLADPDRNDTRIPMHMYYAYFGIKYPSYSGISSMEQKACKMSPMINMTKFNAKKGRWSWRKRKFKTFDM